MVGYSVRPVVGEHDVQGGLELCDAENLVLPHMVCAPLGILRVWSPLKVTLQWLRGEGPYPWPIAKEGDLIQSTTEQKSKSLPLFFRTPILM